jgi:hypothetical protein
MAFYSRSLYRDVGKHWKGVSFLYLLLLLAICWIPIMFKMHSAVSRYVADEVPKIVRQVPVITIDKGEVSIDGEMPYIITEPESDEPFIIIDTTGEYASLENTPARVLITKKELIMKKSPSETRTFDLSDIEYLKIDRQTVYGWIETFRDWFAFLLYPFLVIGSYVYRILQVLLYAAIGIAVARNMAVTLDYQSLLSLAIIADTPAIIVNALYNYGDIALPFWWLICFMISMGYLIFGIKANVGDEDTLSHP